MSKDLFSKQANNYALYRPVYPVALFEYILQFVTKKNIAWDCATGNGQAAIELSNYFEKVIATDSSEKQIENAISRPNIEYAIGKAEQTSFPDSYFDLISVAQAYHWLNVEKFNREVKRIAKDGAIIAIWGYNIPVCGIENMDKLILHFYKQVVGPYWDKERKYVDDEYRTVAFDFQELPAKRFSIDVQWTIKQLAGYLNSWSSVQHFIDQNKSNPVDALFPELEFQWPAQELIPFSFPVFLRVGRIVKGNNET